jgi:hypothetical protein
MLRLQTTSLSLSLIFVVLACGAQGHPQGKGDGCEPYYDRASSRFRIARHYELHAGGGGLAIFVSISPADFEQDNVVALVCKMAREHSSEPSLFIRVFDSYAAARRYNILGEGNDKKTNWSYRAMYGCAEDHGVVRQSLIWRPDPKNFDRWVTIDLGERPKPSEPAR